MRVVRRFRKLGSLINDPFPERKVMLPFESKPNEHKRIEIGVCMTDRKG